MKLVEKALRAVPSRYTFSILERIEVGETDKNISIVTAQGILSVSSNGSKWVKPSRPALMRWNFRLSVSSNGSKWVKLLHFGWRSIRECQTFSILERIEVGETRIPQLTVGVGSVLSVSSNGSKWVKRSRPLHRWRAPVSFSILERIEVGETIK